MSRRQPDVQRNDARFNPETGQEQDKGRVAFAGRHLSPDILETVEAVIAGGLKKEKKAEDEAARVDVRHDEVEDARLARLRFFMLEADEAVGRQRHDFPGDE